jgi:predicted flap endonuclease-1-like 5' DNA nuclease
MALRDKQLAPGRIVQFYPGRNRRPRPAIVIETYDLNRGIVGLFVFWGPKDRDQDIPDLIPYFQPNRDLPIPMPNNAWCWPEEAVSQALMTRHERDQLVATQRRASEMYAEHERQDRERRVGYIDPNSSETLATRDAAVAHARLQEEQQTAYLAEKARLIDEGLNPEKIAESLAHFRRSVRERPIPSIVDMARADDLTVLPNIGTGRAAVLVKGGVRSFSGVASLSVVDLVELLALPVGQAKEVIDAAGDLVESA